MEKVWAELKKIEEQADQIKIQAQNKAKEITALSKQEADKLVADSITYGKQEAQKRYTECMEEANRNREQQLSANKEKAENITKQAQQQMDKAAQAVVDTVLGEEKP